MKFNYKGAIQAGYSPEEIQGFLSDQGINFDVAGAQKAGYSPDEVNAFLQNVTPTSQAAKVGQGISDVARNWLGLGVIPNTLARSFGVGLPGVAGSTPQSSGELAKEALMGNAMPASPQEIGTNNPFESYGEAQQQTQHPIATGVGNVAGPLSYLVGAGEANLGEHLLGAIAPKAASMGMPLAEDLSKVAGAGVVPQLEGAARQGLAKTAQAIVPKSISGALQALATGNTSPQDIAGSAGMNLALPFGAGKIADSALGKVIGDKGELGLTKAYKQMGTLGNVVANSYKDVADKMIKMQGTLSDHISGIFDRSGKGLTRTDAQNLIQHVMDKNGDLALLPEVQDWAQNSFGALLKSAGDAHFKANAAAGKPMNHLVTDFPVKATDAAPDVVGGVKGSTAKVVKKTDPGAQRIGKSNQYMAGKFATEKPVVNKPGGVKTNAKFGTFGSEPTGPMRSGMGAKPGIDEAQNIDTGTAWGNNTTPLPLHIWEDVLQNVHKAGMAARNELKSFSAPPASAASHFAEKLYQPLQHKMMQAMSPEDAVRYTQLKGLKNKAMVVSKHAQSVADGKIAPPGFGKGKFGSLGLGGLGELGAAGATLLGHPTAATALGLGGGLIGAGAGALRQLENPRVATRMTTPVAHQVGGTAARIIAPHAANLGQDISGVISNLTGGLL